MKKKDYNYFEQFVNNASFALESAKLLEEILSDFKPQDLASNTEKMHNIENQADKAKHDVIEFLLKDFLPPIEREDILNILQMIDNVVDYIDEILINIDIFNIQILRNETSQFTELLVNTCTKIIDLLKDFHDFKKYETTKQKIIEINNLEEQGDKLYAFSMKRLYLEKEDPLHVITWTTLFNNFEDCLDACETLSDYTEEIILKNS